MCLPSITEWEIHITAQGPRLRNDLYSVEWDVKPCFLKSSTSFGDLAPKLGDPLP